MTQLKIKDNLGGCIIRCTCRWAWEKCIYRLRPKSCIMGLLHARIVRCGIFLLQLIPLISSSFFSPVSLLYSPSVTPVLVLSYTFSLLHVSCLEFFFCLLSVNTILYIFLSLSLAAVHYAIFLTASLPLPVHFVLALFHTLHPFSYVCLCVLRLGG